MKLSQSILISLSILICFSPITSLAMEQMEMEPLLPMNSHHEITIYDTLNRDDLAQKLISKNLTFFRSIHDTIKYTLQDHLKEISKGFLTCGKITSEFSCFLICVFFMVFMIVGALGDISEAKNPHSALKTLSYITLIITIYLGLCCFRKFFNKEKFEEGRYKDEDLIQDIKRHSTESIEYKLDHKNRFHYFKADKFIKDAILYELPDDIIEKLFDLGGRFPKECFGEIIKNRPFDTVKFLVDLGIDVNTKDINGRPAIIEAVLNNKFEVIRLLALAKADVGIEDAQEKTVYDYLNTLPEADAQKIRIILKDFKKRLKDKIHNALSDEEYNFHKDCAGIISEFIA